VSVSDYAFTGQVTQYRWVNCEGNDCGSGSVLRSQSADGVEGGGGVQVRAELINESFHGGMPKSVETKKIHLVQGLLGEPFLEGHTIGGNEDAGAIIAEAAVHKNLFFRIIVEEREKLNHLFIRGRGPSTDGDLHETHAQGLGLLAFPGNLCGVFTAKIDNGGDAEFFEFGQTLRSGLRAAIKMVIDSAGVGDAGDAKFVSVCRTHRGGRKSLRMVLSGKRKRPKRRKNQEEKRIAFHFG